MNRLLGPSSVLKNFKLNISKFSGSKRGDFFQQEPKLTNQYEEDPFMREQLSLEIPKEVDFIIN